MTDFNELVAELSHGKPLDLSKDEERVDQDEPQGDDQTPDQGEEAEDKPDQEPESKSDDDQEPEDKADEAPEETPAEKGDDAAPDAEADDSADKADDKAEEQTVEIDGEQVPISTLRQWRDQGMMREDYSRKTADVAEIRKKLLEDREAQETLARDIAEDEALQQFLAARPEAHANLMANPEDTRKLMGSPKAVQEFWADYDLIKKSPRLAATLANKAEDGESEAAQELRQAKETETMTTVVSGLEQFINAAQDQFYPDLGPEAAESVMTYVASLADMPENPTHDDQVAAVSKLFSLFYRQNESGEWTIDSRLIQGEFERLKATAKPSEEKPDDEPEDKEVDEHNARVDQQLKDDDRPPKTPDGQPPAAETEKVEYADNFHDLLQDLQHGR